MANKKERMWFNGEIKNHGTAYPIDKLRSDKKLAMSIMLPKETRAVMYLKDTFAVYNSAW